MFTYTPISLVPRPYSAFRRLQYGEHGIFSHVSDVTTNHECRRAKTQQCYCPHAIVPTKMVREFVHFMPSNRALRLPCKVYIFADS